MRALSSAGLEQGTSNSQVGGSSPPGLAITQVIARPDTVKAMTPTSSSKQFDHRFMASNIARLQDY